MNLLFHCAECQRPLNVGDQFAGQPGVCPACRQTIQVPPSSEIPSNEFRDRLMRWQSAQQPPTESAHSTAAKPQPKSVNKKADPSEVKLADAPQALTEKVVSASVVTESQKVATGLTQKLQSRIELPNSIPAGPTSTEVLSPSMGPGNRSAPSNQSESGVWYIRPPGGGQFGPASVTLLNQWVEEGRVTPDSYVWCEGWEDWKLASSAIPNFEDLPFDVVPEGNSDNAAATTARTAYLHAKKRRTMNGVTALIVGTVVVVGLLIVLFFVIKR